ncbi:MAG: amidohydrolase family protein [Deltaproteobacteria bacterium]|nr:MAG: amidohydrolase family protein [Deltaproteobacteria bacterium]
MAKERIISADSHVAIKDEQVMSHLATRFHEDYKNARLRHMAELAKRMKKKAGQTTAMPSQAQPWEAAGRKGEYDPVERLKDMDIDRVDAEVLYCDVLCGTSYYGMTNGGRAAAFEAFNNAALDFASHDPKRLLPVYIVPIVDIDESVREVQRLASAGAKALMLPLYPTDLDLPHYSDRRYDPLWAAIQETGIPISQHVGASQTLFDIMAYDPTPAKGIFQALPPIFMAEALAGWIVPGILERFPSLTVVLVESGLGWIPYFLERLDNMKRSHGWDHYGMLKEKPSFYFHRQMLVTFEEDRFGVDQRHRIGVDNLMWATDYPHPDSTWPNSQKVLETHFDGVPVEEARLMIGGNAARIYGL